jgi:hypothetical protein
VKQCTLVAAALLATLAQTAHGAGQSFHGELALGYDSNIANARQGGDEREVGFALLSLGAQHVWSLGQHSALQGRLDAESQAFTDFDGLDSLKGTGSLRYLFRPGGGFFIPTIAVSGAAGWWEFNSRLRDGADYRASVFVLEQLTTRISARLGGAIDWRQPSAGEVFRNRTRSLGVDVDWTLTNRFALYAGYQRRWGQFVTTRPTPPAPTFLFAPDDAFDGEFATRQEGAANIGRLGFNLALSPMFSVDVQGLHVEAGANTGVHYRRRQAMASLLARF